MPGQQIQRLEQRQPKRGKRALDDADEEAPASKRRRGKDGRIAKKEQTQETYLARVGEDELHLAFGRCVINTKVAAKKMNIDHASVCWGFVCCIKQPHKGFWKGSCEGGPGHEGFDSKLHKAALKQRAAFKALGDDKDIVKCPFR